MFSVLTARGSSDTISQVGKLSQHKSILCSLGVPNDGDVCPHISRQ